MSDKSKPFWPWIVVALIGLPLLYVASFGPACWWMSKQKPSESPPGWPRYAIIGTLSSMTREHVRYAPRFYWPAGWAAQNGPTWLHSALRWYGTLGGDSVNVPAAWNGNDRVYFWPANEFAKD